jgi:hypothetical protein
MITSFEVGSVFKIVNQATPQLRAILKAVTELDKAVETTRKNLTGLARTRFVGVSNQFGTLTKDAVGLDRALISAAGAIGKITKASVSLAETDAAIVGTGAVVKGLAEDWQCSRAPWPLLLLPGC